MVASLWVVRPAYSSPKVTLSTNRNVPLGLAVNGNSVFVGSSVTTADVVKVDASTNTLVEGAGLTLAASAGLVALCVDNSASPATIFAVVDNGASPATVYKIRQDTMALVGSLALSAGETNPTRIIHNGTYVLVLCGTSPGKLVQINGAPATPVRLGALTLGTGEDAPKAITHDGAGNKVYVGCNSTPGRVIKTDVSGGSNPARVSQLDLAYNHVGALEYGRGYDGYLYAANGAPAGVGAAAVYQIKPSDMTVVDSLLAPEILSDYGWSSMVFDSSSAVSPGRYVYALAYLPTAEGLLYQIDTGWKGGGLRVSRRFTFDSGYNVSAGSHLAFNGSYLFYPTNESPGRVVKFYPGALGLVIYPLSESGQSWDRKIIGKIFQPIGADLPISRTYGRNGRAGNLDHVVRTGVDFDAHYIRTAEDEETLALCQPFAFIGDFGPVAVRRSFPAYIGDIHTDWPFGKHVNHSVLDFDYVEIGI